MLTVNILQNEFLFFVNRGITFDQYTQERRKIGSLRFFLLILLALEILTMFWSELKSFSQQPEPIIFYYMSVIRTSVFLKIIILLLRNCDKKQKQAKCAAFNLLSCNFGADEGTRTPMVSRMILSHLRLPFRHIG